MHFVIAASPFVTMKGSSWIIGSLEAIRLRRRDWSCEAGISQTDRLLRFIRGTDIQPNMPPWLGTRCTIALYNRPPICAGWQIYDESWASFRGGNWRCDFRLGGGGNSGRSRNSSRRVRAEHAALRQDRRRSAALARRAAQRGIRPNRRAHEEAECVFHPLNQARPRF